MLYGIIRLYFEERGRTMDFKLVSEYKPTGDQPQAIDALVKGFEEGIFTWLCQVLAAHAGSLVTVPEFLVLKFSVSSLL